MKINDLKLQNDKLSSDLLCYKSFFSNFVDFLNKIYFNLFQEDENIKIEYDLKDYINLSDYINLNDYISLENVNNIFNIIYLNYQDVKEQIRKDIDFYLESDPAITSKEEVILTYPGLKATYFYRIAHLLDDANVAILPRFISEYAHSKTGIDINPRAKIGCPFFIDHGTGIVIGETAVIGDFVKIYHGVTLGASNLSNSMSLKKQKRHPTVGSNVTIYANATILGGNTSIGNHSIIGSNLIITNSIDENTLVYLKNNEVIKKQIQ